MHPRIDDCTYIGCSCHCVSILVHIRDRQVLDNVCASGRAICEGGRVADLKITTLSKVAVEGETPRYLLYIAPGLTFYRDGYSSSIWPIVAFEELRLREDGETRLRDIPIDRSGIACIVIDLRSTRCSLLYIVTHVVQVNLPTSILTSSHLPWLKPAVVRPYIHNCTRIGCARDRVVILIHIRDHQVLDNMCAGGCAICESDRVADLKITTLS